MRHVNHPKTEIRQPMDLEIGQLQAGLSFQKKETENQQKEIQL